MLAPNSISSRSKISPSTAVFWDAVDCPFPPCSDPDEIHRRIHEALGERGFIGEISIWAYVDENNNESWNGDHLRKKTWETRIYFLPGGASRLLNDVLLWGMDSRVPVDHSSPAHLILVSDQVKDPLFVRMLGYLESRRYNVLLAAPTRDVNKPETPEWPLHVLDEAYLFGSESECSEAIVTAQERRHC